MAQTISGIDRRQDSSNARVNLVDRNTGIKESGKFLNAAKDDVYDWLAAKKQGLAEGPPPRFVAAFAASLGKSRTLLAQVCRPSEYAPDGRQTYKGLGDFRTLYLAPTVELCDELAQFVRAARSKMDVRVFRGRTQPDPLCPGERMCRLPDMGRVQENVDDVRTSCCRTVCPKSGKEVVCPFAKECGYERQLAEQKSQLTFATHHFMFLTAQGLRDDDFDLVIIDETFTQTIVAKDEFNLADFLAPRKLPTARKAPSAERLADLARFDEIKDMVRQAIGFHRPAGGELTLEHLRATGLTVEDCEFAAAFEDSLKGKCGLLPGMTAAQRAACLAMHDGNPSKIQSFWNLLAVELAMEQRTTLYGIRMFENRKGKAIVEMQWKHVHRLDEKPVIFLDADADLLILRSVFPEIRDEQFKTIRVRNADCVHIVQVFDTAMPKQRIKAFEPTDESLKYNARWIAKLNDICLSAAYGLGMPQDFPEEADRETAARSERPVVIGYLAFKHGVITKYVGEEIQAIEDDMSLSAKEKAVRVEMVQQSLLNRLPYDLTNFGAHRGKNRWTDAKGAIIIGRTLPCVPEVERTARALYHDRDIELEFIKPDEFGQIRFPVRKEPIRIKNGSEYMVKVAYHEDPLCNSILQQIRDAELMQAIGRIRPVHRQKTCRILIITNTPLAYRGLVVDSLVDMDGLTINKWQLMGMSGVVPFSAEGMVRAFPDLWTSENSIYLDKGRRKAEMDGFDTAENGPRCLWTPAACGGTWAQVSFGIADIGKRFGTWVKVERGDGLEEITANLLRMFPDAVDVVLLAPIPEYDEAVTLRRSNIWLTYLGLIVWLDGELIDKYLPHVFADDDEEFARDPGWRTAA